MHLLPDPWWLSVTLAALLLLDATLSMRPPAFIRDCLDGVHFPRDWWWTLIAIKLTAVAGLLVGLVFPGSGSQRTLASSPTFCVRRSRIYAPASSGRRSGSTASASSHSPSSRCSSATCRRRSTETQARKFRFGVSAEHPSAPRKRSFPVRLRRLDIPSRSWRSAGPHLSLAWVLLYGHQVSALRSGSHTRRRTRLSHSRRTIRQPG